MESATLSPLPSLVKSMPADANGVAGADVPVAAGVGAFFCAACESCQAFLAASLRLAMSLRLRHESHSVEPYSYGLLLSGWAAPQLGLYAYEPAGAFGLEKPA